MRTSIVVIPVKVRIRHKTVKGKDGAIRSIKEALQGTAVLGGMENETQFEVTVVGFKRHDAVGR